MLGLMMPVVGMAHQKYLLHRYEKLRDISPRIIAFWKEPSGWADDAEPIALLSRSSKLWRSSNKIFEIACNVMHGERCNYVPKLPLGWKRKFNECIIENNISSLVVQYGGCAAAIVEELERIKMPIAVTFEGSDAQLAEKSIWYMTLLRRVWARANRCIFVSDFLRQQSIRHGCPAWKSRVIHNGTNIGSGPKIHSMKEKIRLLCVGSFLPVKGHKYLIAAFANACLKLDNLELVLIGEGPTAEGIRQLVDYHALQKRVYFRGEINWEEVQKEMLLSDIYLQPSVRTEDGTEEGLPYSTIEAQAVGVPAIAFRSGGIPEIIEDGKTGLLVKERDVIGFEDSIIKLAASVELRNRMAEKAFDRMSRYFNDETQMEVWKDTIVDMEKDTFAGKKFWPRGEGNPN